MECVGGKIFQLNNAEANQNIQTLTVAWCKVRKFYWIFSEIINHLKQIWTEQNMFINLIAKSFSFEIRTNENHSEICRRGLMLKHCLMLNVSIFNNALFCSWNINQLQRNQDRAILKEHFNEIRFHLKIDKKGENIALCRIEVQIEMV